MTAVVLTLLGCQPAAEIHWVQVRTGWDRPDLSVATAVVSQAAWDAEGPTIPCSNPQSPDLPQTCVGLGEAATWPNALSREAGLPEAYTVDGDRVSWNRASTGYRLMTQREWAHIADEAARQVPSGPLTLAEIPVAPTAPRPAARGLKDPLGLVDLCGNVAEILWPGGPDASVAELTVAGGSYRTGSRHPGSCGDAIERRWPGDSLDVGIRPVRELR